MCIIKNTAQQEMNQFPRVMEPVFLFYLVLSAMQELGNRPGFEK